MWAGTQALWLCAVCVVSSVFAIPCAGLCTYFLRVSWVRALLNAAAGSASCRALPPAPSPPPAAAAAPCCSRGLAAAAAALHLASLSSSSASLLFLRRASSSCHLLFSISLHSERMLRAIEIDDFVFFHSRFKPSGKHCFFCSEIEKKHTFLIGV